MVGERRTTNLKNVNDNQSQQLKVPKLNDNHSHAASKNCLPQIIANVQ